MLGPVLKTARKSGQAMVESVIAMFIALAVFFLLFDLLQAMKSKILVEYAAAKCARARAVGYNDFMLTKIARLSTMPAAGGCKTKDGDGDVLPRAAAVDRMGRYLASEYEAQADAILDFELWDDTFVSVAQDPDCMEVAVTQRRPLSFFGTSFGLMGGNAPAKTKSPLELRVNGFSRIKAHYLDYLSP